MSKAKQTKIGKGGSTKAKKVKPPSKIPKQTLINWVKYYMKELDGCKANTQIKSEAVEELISRFELLLEMLVVYHQEHQVKYPKRRGNSIYTEDVVDFFDSYIRSVSF